MLQTGWLLQVREQETRNGGEGTREGWGRGRDTLVQAQIFLRSWRDEGLGDSFEVSMRTRVWLAEPYRSRSGVVVHTCNPSAGELEVGESVRDPVSKEDGGIPEDDTLSSDLMHACTHVRAPLPTSEMTITKET